jgi:hypothetical protein
VDRYGHLIPDAHIGVSHRLDATVVADSHENPDDIVPTTAPEAEQAGEPLLASDLLVLWWAIQDLNL